MSELGNDAQVIAVAAKLVQAEKNTNPFAVAIPSICSDANLPATAALRGIVPLIDPDTTGADVQNANAASSLTNPFAAQGLSVADISSANGFTNFTRVTGISVVYTDEAPYAIKAPCLSSDTRPRALSRR